MDSARCLRLNVDNFHILSKVGFLRNHRIKRVGSKALESGPMLQSDNQGGTTRCFFILRSLVLVCVIYFNVIKDEGFLFDENKNKSRK